MRREVLVVSCLSILLGVLLVGASSPAFADRVAPQVEIDYGPTALTWTLSFPHQGARLTVAGPGGVRLTQSFSPGQPLSLGLFDETGHPLPDGAYSFELHARRALSAEEREIEAAGQQGGRMKPSEAQRARMELERVNGPFAIRKGGSFLIQGGTFSDPGLRAESGTSATGIDQATGETIVDGGDIMAGSGLAAGSTVVNPSVGELELVNSGTASIEKLPTFLEISSVDGFSDLTVDTASGFVGIGTTTPAHELHIRSVVGIADLFMEDTTSGQSYLLNQGSSGLWFDSTFGAGVLKLQNAAPGNSLVVDSSGRVGIGTGTPGGNLHIYGSPSVDVFNAVGPDPGTTGNSFNFGYSGSTFGTGTGFFNVRPAAGAVAPHPALYFMTGNIDRMIVDNQGYLGLHLDGVVGPGFNPAHPIHAQTSGAFLSAGGIWTNASSRDLKTDVSPLSANDAVSTLKRLQPVHFTYKVEPEDQHVGFIAEDVPDLVATPDHKTLASMDILAVLTRVVQEQQETIDALQKRLAQLEQGQR